MAIATVPLDSASFSHRYTFVGLNISTFSLFGYRFNKTGMRVGMVLIL
jgi:hypothetical protein